MANHLVTDKWDEVKLLAEQGIPIGELSIQFGISIKTIYGRAAAEDWLTPGKVKAKLSQLHRETQKRLPETSLLPGGCLSEKSNSVLLETWETRAQKARHLGWEKMFKALSESDVVIESASDFKHGMHVLRQSTGLLDTDAPQIQLSLFGGGDICGPSIMENQAQGVVELQNEQELDGFWE